MSIENLQHNLDKKSLEINKLRLSFRTLSDFFDYGT